MKYQTVSGSTVEISGKHNGIVTIVFDWFEESACIEAEATASLLHADCPILQWSCECCGDGQARLDRVG